VTGKQPEARIQLARITDVRDKKHICRLQVIAGNFVYPSYAGRSIVRFIFLSIALLASCSLIGCSEPSTPDQNRGENIQLQQRLEEKNSRIAALEQQASELQAQNTRLQTRVAEVASGTFEMEEQQKLLDERGATLDAREQSIIERENTVDTQIKQRRAELVSEMQAREEAVNKREVSIAAKEQDFYDKTNMTMEEIGEAREIKEQYDNMRAERDAANATAEEWLRFVWYVSIALGIVILVCVVLLFITISKHVSAQRELENRREVAQLVSTAIQSQLPPEQGRLVVDAMNRLTRIEGPQETQEPEPA
jgi:hypothetical protein